MKITLENKKETINQAPRPQGGTSPKEKEKEKGDSKKEVKEQCQPKGQGRKAAPLHKSKGRNSTSQRRRRRNAAPPTRGGAGTETAPPQGGGGERRLHFQKEEEAKQPREGPSSI